MAIGFAMPWPAMSGAEPCIGSNMGKSTFRIDVRKFGEFKRQPRPLPELLEHANGLRCYLQADAITGDQGNAMGHVSQPLYSARQVRTAVFRSDT